jgi:hypothetical protein
VSTVLLALAKLPNFSEYWSLFWAADKEQKLFLKDYTDAIGERRESGRGEGRGERGEGRGEREREEGRGKREEGRGKREEGEGRGGSEYNQEF